VEAALAHYLKNPQLKRSLFISGFFVLTYFCIHVIINITNSYEENKFIELKAKQLLGPFTISLCSGLLVFSYSSFLSQAMRHLSILYSDAFYNAFVIFVYAMTIIQIAGHAEILNLSDFKNIPTYILKLFNVLSYLTLPLTFLSLFWLEMYQDKCFHSVEDRLPPNLKPAASNHVLILLCTVASVFISISKPWVQADYWIVFVAEAILAIIAVWSTLRFYAPLESRPGVNANEN
jgi:hypothetical protein